MTAPQGSTDPVYDFLAHVQKITGAYRLGKVTEAEMFSRVSRMAARFQVEAWAGETAHSEADAVLRRWSRGTAA